MARIFDNPLQLTKHLVTLRLLKQDQEAVVNLYEYTPQPTGGVPAGEPHFYAAIDSSLQVVDIEAILSAPASQAELNAIENFLNSRIRIRNIPGYATWTESEALAWYETNLSDDQVNLITNLTQAKAMLKKQNTTIQALARMVLAMRDKLWPDL